MSVKFPALSNTLISLPYLRDQLGESTCKWLRLICKNYRISADVDKDSKLIQTGTWYATEHFQAMKKVVTKAENAKDEKFKQSVENLSKFFKNHNVHVSGYLSVKHFEKKDEWHNILVLRDVFPSEALKVAVGGCSIIDCGIARQMSRYGSLLDQLGEKKFNILFGSSSRGQRMNLGYKDHEHGLQPLDYFVEFTYEALLYSLGEIAKSENKNAPFIVGADGARKVKVGQSAYINGVEKHMEKHPGDPESGYWVICSDATPGRQKFLSFGLPVEGSTEKYIDGVLVQAYNLPTQWDNKEASYYFQNFKEFIKTKTEPLANDQVTGLDPTKSEGFVFSSIMEFKVDLIQDLIALPEEKVSMDFVKNHPSQAKARFEDLIEYRNLTQKFYS